MLKTINRIGVSFVATSTSVSISICGLSLITNVA